MASKTFTYDGTLPLSDLSVMIPLDHGLQFFSQVGSPRFSLTGKNEKIDKAVVELHEQFPDANIREVG